MKWVCKIKGFNGSAKTIINEETGTCPYYNKTEEEYRNEGYDILNDDEYAELVKKWEDGLIGHWKAISEEDYEDALCVLPPVAWQHEGFFMSERYTGNISSFYQKFDGKFYTSLQRMNTPRGKILDSLCKFVKKGNK